MHTVKVVTKNGKDYVYDYKSIWIRPEIHRKLKLLSIDKNASMNEIIEKLIDSYEEKISEVKIEKECESININSSNDSQGLINEQHIKEQYEKYNWDEIKSLCQIVRLDELRSPTVIKILEYVEKNNKISYKQFAVLYRSYVYFEIRMEREKKLKFKYKT
jgi:hypothetical protein